MSLANFPPVAPKDSESHLQLIYAAEINGIDTEILRDFLWLIVAHDHLIALPNAAARIIQILDHAPQAWKKTLIDTGVYAWRPTLDWILLNKGTLAETIGAHFVKETNTTGHNPMLGSGAASFPMYTVLCEPLPPGVYGDKYILLAGQLLLANVTAMRENSSRPDYERVIDKKDWKPLPNDINTSTLAVRRLAEPDFNHGLLDLPLELSPDEFAEALEEILPPEELKLAEDRPSLYRFLQKSWGIIEWVDRLPGESVGGKGGHRWIGGLMEVGSKITIEEQPIGDEDDIYDAWGKIKVVKVKTTSARKKSAHLKSDLPPDEDEDDEDIFLSDFDCSVTKKDAGALARTTHAKARHVSSANQMVPWAYNGLALEEVARLLGTIKNSWNLLIQLPSWNDEQWKEAEILTLIHVMLWTGSDARRAASARFCDENRYDIASDIGVVTSYARPIDRIFWRIKALAPDYKTDLDGTQSELRERKPTIDLPDTIDLASLIERIISNRERVRHGSALFITAPPVLEKSLKLWLKSYSTNGRVTTTKIAGTLWNHLYRDYGDSATVSCITGGMHSLARVRLFYTSPSIAILQKSYLATVLKISKMAYSALGKPMRQVTPWMPAKSAEGAVGARLCPTVDAVRNMFEKLITDIDGAADYTDRKGFINYHNLYTLYTLQYFAYATTCRAIVTPYLPLGAVHPTRGLASLSDKDDESCHKTRLVWIPHPLREQMAEYENHLKTLKPQLIRPPTTIIIEPCFFLDDDFVPIAARPKTIEPQLMPYLNVRANTHRRFLRTELIERQCPPEVVDAFMGHWQQGEEPFGDYSSFSFADYVGTLRSYLEPLLSDIALQHPISSRLGL